MLMMPLWIEMHLRFLKQEVEKCQFLYCSAKKATFDVKVIYRADPEQPGSLVKGPQCWLGTKGERRVPDPGLTSQAAPERE